MEPSDENRLRSDRVRTHYDNLKVARDAPIEVIRAAYKALSARYHPDHNPGNDQAARAMKIINAAYEVLSDPIMRHQHDQWIASMEGDPIKSAPPFTYGPTTPSQRYTPPSPASGHPPWNIRERATRKHAIKWVALAAGGAAAIFMSLTTPKNSPASGRGSIPTPVAVPAPVSEPAPIRLRFIRPALDPSGSPWPLTSGYLTEYRVNADDLSSFTVDNARNNSDMLVKLFDRRPQRPVAVRVFFLRAHEKFTLANVAAGPYDIRYQDLDSGIRLRSQPFNLEEIQQPDGSVQYSVTSLTLFVVSNGNTRSEVIGPDEF
jgi:hypothetical protein